MRAKCAVILAAGRGLRLREVLADTPKGFIAFGRQTIIERSIQQLHRSGIEDILIVSGYQSHRYEQLAERIPAVRTVENSQYESTGSLFSLTLALPLVSPPFLLLESDLVYESRSLTAILSQKMPSALLLSGFTNHGDEVFVDGPHLRFRYMSKDREKLESIVGEFVGISLVGAGARKAIADYAAQAVGLNPQLDYEESFNGIADSQEIGLCRIDDLVWTEIDNPQHLAAARGSILPRLAELEEDLT